MEKEMRELFDFLDESVSPFHAVQSCERLLRQEGFQRVEESGQWELNPEIGRASCRERVSS